MPTMISEVSTGPRGAAWVRYVAEYQDIPPVGYESLADLLDHHGLGEVDLDWQEVYFGCRPDEEFAAEEFWGELQGQRVGSKKLALATMEWLLDAINSHRLTPPQFAAIRSLPGWADGPEHAKYALLIDGPFTD